MNKDGLHVFHRIYDCFLFVWGRVFVSVCSAFHLFASHWISEQTRVGHLTGLCGWFGFVWGRESRSGFWFGFISLALARVWWVNEDRSDTLPGCVVGWTNKIRFEQWKNNKNWVKLQKRWSTNHKNEWFQLASVGVSPASPCSGAAWGVPSVTLPVWRARLSAPRWRQQLPPRSLWPGQESGELTWLVAWLVSSTLWLCQNSYWTWPFLVDFPIKNGYFP